MQSTKPSLNGQENGQQTMDASSSSSQSESSRFDGLIKNLKGSKISNSKLREEVFNILLDDATESPESGKYYTFEYDPKFADRLKKKRHGTNLGFLVEGDSILGLCSILTPITWLCPLLHQLL